MRIRLTPALIALAALAVFAGVAIAQQDRYDGESYCADAKAWPEGSFLGQFHPWHQQHYINTFGREIACGAWATDQRNSAIIGLRKAGHTVSPPPTLLPHPAAVGEPTVRTGGQTSGVIYLEPGQEWRIRTWVENTSPERVTQTYGGIDLSLRNTVGSKWCPGLGSRNTRHGRPLEFTPEILRVAPAGLRVDADHQRAKGCRIEVDGTILLEEGFWRWNVEAYPHTNWEIRIEQMPV